MSNRCPTQGELVTFALGDAAKERGAERVASHIRLCASCREAVASLKAPSSQVRQAARAQTIPLRPCLDDVIIAELAEGVALPEARTAATLHLIECARCRTLLADVCRALRDDGVAEELARITPPGTSKRRLTLASIGTIAGLAAAVVLVTVMGTGPGKAGPAPKAMRDETVTRTAAPTIISPLGNAPSAPVFRWSKVPQADLYRVTVFDSEGVVIWETSTKDTTAAVTEPTALRREVNYLWKVEARTDFDR